MISVTVLSDYLYCPRKVYLRYVLKFVPIVRKAMIVGRVKHDVFDAINKNEEDLILNIKPSELENIESVYKQTFSNLLASSISKFESDIKDSGLDKERLFSDSLKKFLDEASYKAKTLKDFIQKTGLFGKDLLDAIPGKYKSELFLSSRKLRLKGIIDKVEVLGNVHVPVELKTGSMPQDGVWPGHRIQLASYILLLNEKFKSDHGFVDYLDYDVRRKIVMNPFLEDEVKELVGNVQDLLNSSEIPKICDNPNKCKSCNFKGSCFS